MKSRIKKRAGLVFFVLAIITSILLGYVSTIQKESPFQSYKGLDATMTGELNNATNGKEYRELIENSQLIGKTELKNDDTVIQKLTVATNILNSITIDMEVYADSVLDIKVTNEKNKEIFIESIAVTKDTQKLTIPLNGIKHDRMDVFNIEMNVASDSQQKSLSIFNCDYPDGTLSINDKLQKKVLLTKVEGSLIAHKEKSVIGLTAATIVFFVLALIGFVKNNGVCQSGLDYILSSRWKMYGLEIIGYIGVLLLGIGFYASYTYKGNIDFIGLYLFVFITIIWSTFIYFMIKKYRHSIEDIFAILAIPVGLSFVFLILPDQVPDEHAHFAKAYLTSTFDFSNNVDVKITEVYGTLKLRNYNDILPSIFQLGNYADTITYNHACPYNFLLYIIPSIGLFLCRMLELSIYFAYYIGRILNLLFFIYIGYRCIKAVPVAKYVFFIYLFNPMVLQQAASYSSDMMVHSLLIVVIVYFLWLYNKESRLTNIDIISVFMLMLFVAIFKYVYLPVFIVYLLLYKKLLKMDKKQVILFVSCLIGVGVGYVAMAVATGPIGTMDGMQKYLTDNKVDSMKQISYMIAHPKGALYMIKDTLLVQQYFYAQSFVGMFGWLSINLGQPITAIYFGTMILSPFLVEEKIKFKKPERICMALVGIFSMLLIIVAMYITWTPVGRGIAEGVQGRYFIPLVILILLAYTGTKRIILKNPLLVCATMILIVNISALNSIMNYFTFLV